MTRTMSLDGRSVPVPAAAHSDPDPAGLSGHRSQVQIVVATGDRLEQYRSIRREVFCSEQRLFGGKEGEGDDGDEADLRGATASLVAVVRSGEVLGGVRVSQVLGDTTGAWWRGSRLALSPRFRGRSRVAAALVRSACGYVAGEGALRFDATVQLPAQRFFAQLGWQLTGQEQIGGRPHVTMRWPVDRFDSLLRDTKGMLGQLLGDLGPGGKGFVGDDAAPIRGTGLVATTDAILPSMVERDPDWAGWCSVLVNMNDLAAMGATPVAVLDALGAPDIDRAAAVLGGIRRAAAAWGVEVLGGHTQVGVPPALAVTALGRTDFPASSGGGRPGHVVRLTADLSGAWRSGYHGSQWDSTSARDPAELAMLGRGVAVTLPAAAKDVGMAGIVGTLAVLAESSGCGAELEVSRLPRPPGTALADWLTCFPGFAMLTCAPQEDDQAPPLPPGAVSVRCGRLVEGQGVKLLWPDGQSTIAVSGPATGLGRADGQALSRTAAGACGSPHP